MKWLFAILVAIVESVIAFFILYVTYDGFIFLLLIFSFLAGLFIKSTNIRNSIFRNNLAFGLMIGTLLTVAIIITYIIWLMFQVAL